MSNGMDDLLARLMESNEIPQRVSNQMILAVVLDVRKTQKDFNARIEELERANQRRAGIYGFVDKYAAPIITALITAGLMWAIFGAP